MACDICDGLLGHCPVCGETKFPEHTSWLAKMEHQRRHQGTHENAITNADLQPPAAAQGLHSIDNGGSRLGPKYSRAWHSGYSGPGKGTW